MTDATTHGHRHAHDHASGEELGVAAHVHSRRAGLGRAHTHAAPARASLLEASAGARLAGVSLVVALLWAGVYWALH